MSRCAPRKHSTEARDPETRRKIQVFNFSCPPCGIFGKAFRSRSARDKFALDHQ